MGCHGTGKVARLAEIIAGFCLALDLSTLAAVASGQFATAHERLGRNRPVDWFTRDDLTPEFFTPGARRVFGEHATVTGARELQRTERGSSILTELTARKTSKLVGHVPYALIVQDGERERVEEVMVKVKPVDGEVVLMINAMAGMCGGKLTQWYSKFRDRTGFAGVHTRELAIYQQTDPRFTQHAPTLYAAHEDPEREAYVLVLERLADMRHMDSAADVSGWTQRDMETVVDGMAQLHSIWLGRERELMDKPWIGHVHDARSMAEMRPLWESLGVHAAEEFPEWISEHDLELHRALVRDVDGWWPALERMPRTLIHNDFNPRNLCLRPTDDGGHVLCAYDWELATVHVPQHDLAEFLAFVLDTGCTRAEILHFVELHRRALEHYAQVELDEELWREGFALSLFDLIINRTALYIMAHTFRHYAFMERVFHTLRRMITVIRGY